MTQGWIKFHREWFDNPTITKDAEHLAVWVYLMSKASFHKKEVYFGGEKMEIKEGQLLITCKEICEDLRIERSKLSRILKSFKNEQLIEQQTNNHKTLITLARWELYQGINEQPSEQQMSDQRATEKETEKEKEKRSKREKEKEKEIYNKERRKEAPTGRAFYDLRRKGDLSSPPTYGDADEFFDLAVARSYEDDEDEPLDTSG